MSSNQTPSFQTTASATVGLEDKICNLIVATESVAALADNMGHGGTADKLQKAAEQLMRALSHHRTSTR